MLKGFNYRKKLAEFRFMIARGYMWCQTPGLAIILAGVIKPYFPNWTLYELIGMAFLAMLLAGYLDRKLKIINEEQSYITKVNPTLNGKLDKILKILENEERKEAA
jgi:hypothetical protein